MASGSLFSSTPAVQAQLRDLVEIAAALLGQNLVGMYMGSSNPGQPSNAPAPALHLLIVTARDVLRETKLGLVQALLQRSLQPAALEVLVVRQADLADDNPSLLIQLHFAEGLRPQLTTDTTSLMWLQ